MKSTPKNDAHIWNFLLSIFSRNQVNHQTHIYYISRNYLELGQILESKHCLKNLASRSEVNPPKRHTHLKKNSRFSLEKPSQPSQPPKSHILYLEKLSRARSNPWKQTLFEKFSLENWSQPSKTTHTFEIFCSRFSRETKSTKSTTKCTYTISWEIISI